MRDADKTPVRKSRWRSRRLWLVLTSILIALGLALTFLPAVGLRWGLVSNLRKLGMVDVSLLESDLSLFKGRVTVRGMAARPSSGDALALDDLALRFNWRPLLKKRVSFQAVALKGLSISVTRQGDNWDINGLPVIVGAAAGAAMDAAKTDEPSSGKPWTFDVGDLDITDSRLTLTDGKMSLDIQVAELSLSALRSWQPDSPAPFHLKGSINGAPIELEGSATPLADQPGGTVHLKLDGLDLAALAPLAETAAINRLGGKLTADLTATGQMKAANAIDGGVSGSFNWADGVLSKGGNEIKAQSLGWVGQTQWNDGKAEGVAQISLRKAALKSPEGQVQAAEFDLKLDRLTADPAAMDIALAGQVTAAGLAIDGAGMTLATGGSALDAKDVTVKSGKLAWTGALTLRDVKFSQPGIAAAQDRLAWTGKLDLDMADPTRAALKGRVEGAGLHLDNSGLLADVKTIGSDVSVSGGAQPSAQLTLQADGLAVSEPRLGMDWAELDHLAIGSAQLSTKDGAALRDVAASGISALRRKAAKDGYPWRLTLRDLKADQVNALPSGAVSLGEARFSGLSAHLMRTGAGFVGFDFGGDGKPDTSGKPPDLPKVSAGRVILADSTVVFEDRTPSQTVKLKVDKIDLTVSRLNTAAPEQDSPFTAKARLGQATVKANGAVRPFSSSWGTTVTANVEALELPPLSPYAADALGMDLRTGQFNGDLTLSIRQHKLDGTLKMVLDNLFVAEPPAGSPISAKAKMPVATVLDLLRDGENRVRLSIPIAGDLDNPDFDISDAINQTVAGALRSTALTTLEVLFPLAAIIDLASGGDNGLGLEPLAFDPGQEVVPPAQRKRIDAVAELLRQRPALKLTLCGFAQPESDWAPLYERRRQDEKGLLAKLQNLLDTVRKEPPPPADWNVLQGLAEQRGRNVKAVLAGELGIDPNRLYECRGAVMEPGAKGGPRVEMNF